MKREECPKCPHYKWNGIVGCIAGSKDCQERCIYFGGICDLSDSCPDDCPRKAKRVTENIHKKAILGV